MPALEVADDQVSSFSVQSFDPSPDSITMASGLARRVRALTLKLLPIEVSPDSISEPTSRIITSRVINAYIAAAGDFVEPLPYCLLLARKQFMLDANKYPADYEENEGRAVACEVLARRVIHYAPPEKISTMMTARYRHRELDGDVSGSSSALEMAIDAHCTIFLSSSEAQDVVQDMWCGRIVQLYDSEGDVSFVPHHAADYHGFWSHLSPSRLGVPRYQNVFRIIVWFIFLFTYSQAVREPLDKVHRDHNDLDNWEIVLYVLALAFAIEKIFKLLVLVSWRAFGFWNVVSFITDCLLTAAFTLRMIGIVRPGKQEAMILYSFQCLSFAAPSCELIPIFDGYKFVGTMQICVARMLKESGFFFCLLALLGIGFLQGLYALDAADGQTDHPTKILHVLIQSLLQSPNYEAFPSAVGLSLYYLWNVATAVILLNVLISLFSSAYEDVIGDAAAEYLTYFAGKVVSMIRAPDEFIYPPPFNLIEIFFVAPFEYFVSEKTYGRMNRRIMSILFFVPLVTIALFEAHFNPEKHQWVKDWFSSAEEGGDDAPQFQDPQVTGQDSDRGLVISKVPFKDIVAKFPDATHSPEAVMMQEMKTLRAELAEMKELIKHMAAGGAKGG
ncbi:uncharacterized protein BXZ73DRAFT_87627 [Epithele typhae]|uniref:uncharacterized protein n=1 Tax=Epithele typhae TaxID=378194 RepID=UPI0020075325|nr:uncharacterized protein BXZ73DRAFT_87627 [Epithele typhae]KAH9943256.1 hypothetical protein BXZ73DRAFT_87627 [Epithele typhae]